MDSLSFFKRKRFEFRYRKLTKKANKLKKRILKLLGLSSPDLVKINILKSRGIDIMEKIHKIERALNIEDKNAFKIPEFFK